jgi:hypothetical protein
MLLCPRPNGIDIDLALHSDCECLFKGAVVRAIVEEKPRKAVSDAVGRRENLKHLTTLPKRCPACDDLLSDHQRALRELDRERGVRVRIDASLFTEPQVKEAFSWGIKRRPEAKDEVQVARLDGFWSVDSRRSTSTQNRIDACFRERCPDNEGQLAQCCFVMDFHMALPALRGRRRIALMRCWRSTSCSPSLTSRARSSWAAKNRGFRRNLLAVPSSTPTTMPASSRLSTAPLMRLRLLPRMAATSPACVSPSIAMTRSVAVRVVVPNKLALLGLLINGVYRKAELPYRFAVQV